MFLSFFLILGLSTVSIRGDLVCLGWGLINPIVGLICHFQSDTFHVVENATLAAVDEAVQSAKHLAQFDLTHSPVSVTYNFLAQTKQGGLGQGGQSLANATKDFQEVTVGFAKESANQVVQIYDLSHWNDISFCLISGAGRLVTQAAQTARKRAGAPSASNIRGMAQGCVSKKLKQIARPAIFKTTSLLLSFQSAVCTDSLSRPEPANWLNYIRSCGFANTCRYRGGSERKSCTRRR